MRSPLVILHHSQSHGIIFWIISSPCASVTSSLSYCPYISLSCFLFFIVWSSQSSPFYSPPSSPYFRLLGSLLLSGSCPGSIIQVCLYITTLPGLSLGSSGSSILFLIVLLELPSYKLCCCWWSYILIHILDPSLNSPNLFQNTLGFLIVCLPFLILPYLASHAHPCVSQMVLILLILHSGSHPVPLVVSPSGLSNWFYSGFDVSSLSSFLLHAFLPCVCLSHGLRIPHGYLSTLFWICRAVMILPSVVSYCRSCLFHNHLILPCIIWFYPDDQSSSLFIPH